MATGVGARAARTVARAPIRIYDAGYGRVFGERILMLQHTGRRSGLPRFVVLEVVRRLPGDRYVVPAGTGETADWYRNVGRDPHVRVWVGRRRGAAGTARLLDRTEAREHFEAYRAERRVTWRFLAPVISRILGRPGQTDEELFAAVPLVELTLTAPG